MYDGPIPAIPAGPMGHCYVYTSRNTGLQDMDMWNPRQVKPNY